MKLGTEVGLGPGHIVLDSDPPAPPKGHRSRIRILRIFFLFLNLTNFTNFFSVEKNSQKIRNFANHRCLTCFDVLECNVHL